MYKLFYEYDEIREKYCFGISHDDHVYLFYDHKIFKSFCDLVSVGMSPAILRLFDGFIIGDE